MVAMERRKVADTEDEAKELRAEMEALRNAMRLLESQGRLSQGVTPAGSPNLDHARNLSASSARAIKSPPSTRPSSPEADEDPTSAGTIVTSYQHRPPPLTIVEPASPLPPSTPPAEANAAESSDTTLVAEPSSLSVTPSPSSSSSPSPKPSPSSASSEGGSDYFPIRARALDFLPREASPWADVDS